MADATSAEEVPRRTSPWPLFIALGLAISEVGVLFGVVPLTVGGILLFGGSVAGILRETEYAATTWRPLALIGGVFVVLGGALWAVGTDGLSVWAVLEAPTISGIAFRGTAVVIAGTLLIAAAVAIRVWSPAIVEP